MRFGLSLIGILARGLAMIAALLLGLLPAAAADVTAGGTKNFTPPSGTPSYFTGENGQVRESAPAVSDTEERDEAGPGLAQPRTDTASREESAPPTVEHEADTVSHSYSRHGRHGGRYARNTHGRGSSRHTVSLRHETRSGRGTTHTSSHAASHTSSRGHARGVVHAGSTHSAPSRGRSVHAQPKSSRHHAEARPAPALDSA